MHPFRTKRYVRETMSSPLVLVALLVLAAFLGNAAWGAFKGYRAARAAEALALSRVKTLETEEAALQASVGEMGSARASEREAREKLHMALPGEEVIVMVNDKGSKETAAAPANEHWWQKWWQWATNQ